ncbi:MAG: hypothetical protein MUO40_11120, partial [Anaerolineaceae bacterium]|nr:hypothetical protein [Anaerolineaceae bacterium]
MVQGLDLSSIFKAVTGTLVEKKADLNNADEYNHDHGDHMVEIFDLIQKSVSKKKTATPASQLSYAAQQLRKEGTSGSAKVYAENLDVASKNLKGKQLTADTIGTLVQSLMGIQQPQKQSEQDIDSGGLLGSLLSGLSGSQTKQSQDQSGDLLSSLLTGLSGGNQQQGDKGLDMGDLLNAGMSFFGAKQKGGSNLEAIMSVLANTSTLGQSDHRKQSGALVINTILNLVNSMKK